MTLLLRRGDICDCPLVDVADPVFVAEGLLEAGVVKPDVVVLGVLFNLLLVLDAALGEDDIFNAFTLAKLLLKGGVRLVEELRFGAWESIEGVFVDYAGTLEFFEFGFVSGLLVSLAVCFGGEAGTYLAYAINSLSSMNSSPRVSTAVVYTSLTLSSFPNSSSNRAHLIQFLGSA